MDAAWRLKRVPCTIFPSPSARFRDTPCLGIMYTMKATTQDGAFTFEIIPRDGKFIGTVWSHISSAYDTTGRTDPGYEWPFDSLADAKAWACAHLTTQLRVPGD